MPLIWQPERWHWWNFLRHASISGKTLWELLTTPSDFAGNYHPLSFVDGYYNGCVITIVDGSSARGRRFRVVDYFAHSLGLNPMPPYPLPTQHKFRVMPIAISSESSNIRPVAGDRVLLNGRPFNGTGFGYGSSTSGTTPKLNPAYALQPNQLLQTNAAQLASFVAGDADESYDAVDFQNMALAGIIPTSTSIAPDGVVVVPSFHRPELVYYWGINSSTSLDRAIMRPMPWDHPDFDGSNPQLTLPKSAANRRPTDALFPDPSDSGTQRSHFSRDSRGLVETLVLIPGTLITMEIAFPIASGSIWVSQSRQRRMADKFARCSRFCVRIWMAAST